MPQELLKNSEQFLTVADLDLGLACIRKAPVSGATDAKLGSLNTLSERDRSPFTESFSVP